MQIIAGKARGIILQTPQTQNVRPTAGRSRKALFDSLGSFEGASVVDLCAGSGALGLEAASRGAAEVMLVELDRRHCRFIEKNIAAVVKAGADCVIRLAEGNAADVRCWRTCRPDVVFADPPYAVSAELWNKLKKDQAFLHHCAGALIVWEIPDTPGSAGLFLEDNPLTDFRMRNFGGTDFMTGRVPDGGGAKGE